MFRPFWSLSNSKTWRKSEFLRLSVSRPSPSSGKICGGAERNGVGNNSFGAAPGGGADASSSKDGAGPPKVFSFWLVAGGDSSGDDAAGWRRKTAERAE